MKQLSAPRMIGAAHRCLLDDAQGAMKRIISAKDVYRISNFAEADTEMKRFTTTSTRTCDDQATSTNR
jgi:hypothetical protein